MQALRRLILLAATAWAAVASAKSVTFTTWNMKWFPSGRMDLRVSAAYEEFKIAKAGSVLSNAVASVGGPADGIVLFVQEMRDTDVCTNLVAKTGLPKMQLAAVSKFKDAYGYPLWQQCAIATDLPVVESGYMSWQSEPHVAMPRGFTFAVVGSGDELIACFAVHLKSNVNFSGEELENQRNIYKREYAARQILEKLRELTGRYGKNLTRAVVAGDFNTNEDDERFVSEETLLSFYGAHFRSCFRGLKKEQCVTHPGEGKYPDCTFDHILYRGFGDIQSRKIGVGAPISDHNPVSLRLDMTPRRR